MRKLVALGAHVALVLVLVGSASPALAVGESENGFPNWKERVMHEWANRARVDPQVEMAKCGAACGEAACFAPIAPLRWSKPLAHAARFHSAHMAKNSYFAHDSKCALLTNVDALYPGSCDGSASCSCMGGTLTGTTLWSKRVSYFGASAGGEIIASGTDPNGAFYQWLYESSSDPTCAYSASNGHRWNILTSTGGVAFGAAGPSVGDFGSGAEPAYPIPSGAHYPQSGASVDLWVNWYADTPQQALVNLGGTCQPLVHTLGSTTNGAWKGTAAGLSGCVRYYFLFKDATGASVTYPSTGSLGIGDAACVEWSTDRPTAGAGCDCAPSCGPNVCGDDGCGGVCGTCPDGSTCDGGQCVTDPTGGGGAGGDPTGGGGEGGAGGDPTGGGGEAGAGGDPTGGAGTAGTAAAGKGGAAGKAGTSGSGGAGGKSGTAGTGTGGATGGKAGASGTGGATSKGGTGGAAAKGGTTGAAAAGGATSTGGASNGDEASESDDGGCGCRVASPRVSWGALALLALAVAARRRRAS